MKRICILGGIGSGKSFIAKNFGYPVFNADQEVSRIYFTNKKIFKKLNRILPNYFSEFPIRKNFIVNAILSSKNNLKKIVQIVHPEVRKKMNYFLKKNKKKKFVILDIPLILENKIYNKNDILIFIESNNKKSLKKLKLRKNYNAKIYRNFKSIQLPLDQKKKKADYIIKNNFLKKPVKVQIQNILKRLNNE